MESNSNFPEVLREQRAAFARRPFPSAADRICHLRTLERLLLDHAAAICEAIASDFGHRSHTETRLLELFPSVEAARHARRHVRRWMRPERRRVSIWFLPGRAAVRYQPLGCVGIIVPWNYPLFLAIGPLVAALAAGNRAMIKLSEYTPAFAELFAALIAEHFPRDLIHIVRGDAHVGAEFAALPFDHLLFTGSTQVGRSIMAAAAANLTPVTLELGGKSPAIIAPDFDIATAARRIAFGKLVNAGQTCIAPDYVLVPRASLTRLVEALRAAAHDMYGTIDSADYSSIAHDKQHARLHALLEDAIARGARIEQLLEGDSNRAPRRFQPVAIVGATDSMRVMQEEIFGPVLPLLGYDTLEEAIAYVNSHDRPLAMYLFDDDEKRRENVLERTASGGVTINDTLLHVGQESLPFGGIGPSGMGRYHGLEGFRTFSQVRSVFEQSRLATTSLMYPPYRRGLVQKLLKLMLR